MGEALVVALCPKCRHIHGATARIKKKASGLVRGGKQGNKIEQGALATATLPHHDHTLAGRDAQFWYMKRKPSVSRAMDPRYIPKFKQGRVVPPL